MYSFFLVAVPRIKMKVIRVGIIGVGATAITTSFSNNDTVRENAPASGNSDNNDTGIPVSKGRISKQMHFFCETTCWQSLLSMY